METLSFGRNLRLRPAGRKATETNAFNDVTRFTYNDRNQVTRTWGDVPYPVEYVYDSYGRVSQMRTWRISAAWTGATWPSGVSGQEDVTTWTYDEGTGLLTSKTDDNSESVAYTYTTAGQLASRTWARGAVTNYDYSPTTGELLTVNYSDSTPDVTFTYDRLGRIKTVADGLGNRTFSYNTALQPDTETITGLYNTSITRNYAASGVIGRPSGLTMGALYTQTYGYDTKGRYNATNWTVNALSGSAAYTYVTSSDLLGTLTTGSGQLTTYSYEANRNLRTQINNQFSSTLISQYDYAYDAIGRRTSVKNSGSAFSTAAFNRFTYNDRSELNESARYLGTDINVLTSPVTAEYRSFVYDPIGNRTNITVAANNGTYSANNLNQYSTENVAGGGTNNFTYDDDGNLTVISGVKNVTYTYNAENQLITAAPTTPALNDKKLDLVYDYQGRRVQKIVSNWTGVAWVALTTKRFVYDGWNVLEEQTVAGTSKYYVWGLDLSQSLQGAGGIGGLLTMFDGVGSYAYLYDGNGNVGQMVNSIGGAIAAHYEYDPYGNQIVASGSLAAGNPYRFSTKYLDTEHNLYYYLKRYYDSLTGRWLSRDPLEENGGTNLYEFVFNNSVSSIDPFGLALYAFDGTGQTLNDRTNVAKLYDLYLGTSRRYLPGVGSNRFTRILGGITGLGGRNRISEMYKELVKFYNTYDPSGENQKIDIIGYSRGAALARAFVNYINQRGGVEILDSNGKGTDTYCPVKIRFLGLFDTVASFGIPGNNINLGYNLSVPTNVENVRQATALDEQRYFFPLTSVLTNPNNPTQDPRIVEQTFTGTHGNIGGGEKNSDLSKVTLKWMRDEAVKIGVPFRPLDTQDTILTNPVVSPTGGHKPREIYY